MTPTRTSVRLQISLAVILGAAALRGEEPGWYRVQLGDGEPLTVKLVSVEPGFYLLDFQGSVLRVEKRAVRRLERLASPEGHSSPLEKAAPSGEGKASPEPAAPAGVGEPPSQEPSGRQTAVRDAIETLARPDEGLVNLAYQLLATNVATARPDLHRALQHRSHRVRLLTVKLLGEYGKVKEDLTAVAGRLSDDHVLVRRAAVVSMRTLGPAGLPALVRYLPTEREPSNRKVAVQTLKLWKDARAVVPLVELLSREEDDAVRGFSAAALEALTGQKLGKEAPVWWAYLGEQKRLRDAKGVAESAAGARTDPTRGTK